MKLDDGLGGQLSDIEDAAIVSVEDRPTKMTLNAALIQAYHKKVLGPGFWERRNRRDMASRYWLSPEQNAALAPPTLKGTKVYHTLKTVEASGAGRHALEAHDYLRFAVKTGLRLHESISAHGKALRDFEQTRLYGEDGAALAEFRFVRADAFAADEVDQDEEIRLARYIAADARKAARTIIRTRKAARANEAKLSKALGLVSQAEGLAAQAKAFAAAAAGLSWDTMQVLGQSDLALSATRRSLVETRFTERLRSRLKGELADRAARRKRDESNALVIADFDKYIGEESRTTTKIGQVRTALTPRHWLPVPPLYQWSGGALRGRCTLWRLQDLRPQRPRLQGPRLQGSRAGQELRGRLRPFPGEAA